MTLTIEKYNRLEMAALKHLSNVAIQAFQPVSFRGENYPCRVYDEAELIRYVDVMHEGEEFKYWPAVWSYSMDEGKLISEICDQVVRMTSDRFGSPTRPLISPVAAMDLFRGIHAISSLVDKEVLSVFELGPGSGYLGAFLISMGYRYASMDNTQAFYLWQHRLYDWLAPGEFTELACDDLKSMDPSKRVVHVPWWEYCKLHESCPFMADIVVCDHALLEMSEHALKYVLRISKKMLVGPGPKLFMFSAVGASLVSSIDKLAKEFKEAGFVPVMEGWRLLGMAPIDSDLGRSAQLPYDPFSSSISARVIRKIKRFLLTRKDRELRPSVLNHSKEPRYYNPSANPGLVRAHDFMPVRENESPRDYGSLKFIGYRTPEPHDLLE